MTTPITLDQNSVSNGLTNIQKSADGSTYAFSVLNLEGRGISDLGD